MNRHQFDYFSSCAIDGGIRANKYEENQTVFVSIYKNRSGHVDQDKPKTTKKKS